MAELPDCHKDVYLYGVSLGYFDMKKEDAEAYCKTQTERTGRLHDWHYVGGRVHIKALDGRPIPAGQVMVPRELLDRIEAALTRHLSQHGPMRVPVDPTDSDLVREEVRDLIRCATKSNPD